MPKPRVLVVEDEPIIRQIIAETLSKAGYQVEEAASADAAASLIEADGYRLLVTDINMPGRMDGLQLAELAKHHDHNIPVVIVTGRPDLAQRFCDNENSSTVLSKPFRLAALVQVVASYVRPD